MKSHHFLSILALAACSGASENSEKPETSIATKSVTADYLGRVVLVHNNVFSGNRTVVSLDLPTRNVSVLATGQKPIMIDGDLIFQQRCGKSGTQIAIQDEDGFLNTLSPCFKRQISYSNAPAVSPDKKSFVTYHSQAEAGSRGLGLTHKAPALEIFKGENAVAKLFGYNAPTYSADAVLYAAGVGEDKREGAPYGIYRVAQDLSSATRIDDGRINSPIRSLSIHPNGTHALFVMNGQIWEMDISTGAPKRLLMHRFEIFNVAYSPDGQSMVFVVRDPNAEKISMKGGYRIHIYDREKTTPIFTGFPPEGPLSWHR